VSEVNMLGPLDIHQYLLAHDIHHEIVRLPRPASSAEHLAEVLGVPPRFCLAIQPFHAMTPDGDVLVLLLSPAEAALDLDSVAVVPDRGQLTRALGDLLRETLGPTAALTTAGADLVSSHTDYLAGHLAPLLLPADVIVVATQSLVDLAASIIYTPTGDGGTALGIAALDLLALTRARLLPEAAPAARAAWIELERPSTSIHLDEQARADRVRRSSPVGESGPSLVIARNRRPEAPPSPSAERLTPAEAATVDAPAVDAAELHVVAAG
jgi:Cys-tRNA(Pro)/Cys-tRNA(Cys) deacylase